MSALHDSGCPGEALTLASAVTMSFDELEIGNVIGQGSFGKVYLADYHGTDVAVKHLAHIEEEGELTKYIGREVAVLSSIRHPHILQFMGLARKEDTKDIYIVTEYLPAGDLSKLLANEGIPLGWKLRTKMMLEVTQAVSFLHAKDIIHRDLKTENVFLHHDFRTVLGDCGFARVLESTASQKSRRKYMSIVGTDSTMAPETIVGEPYDEKADIYSLGVVLSELLTRAPPGQRSPAAFFEFDADHFKSHLPGDAPKALTALVLDMTAYEPAKRPTAKEVIKALKALFTSLPEDEEVPSVVPQSKGTQVDEEDDDDDDDEGEGDDDEGDDEEEDVEDKDDVEQQPQQQTPEPNASVVSSSSPSLSSPVSSLGSTHVTLHELRAVGAANYKEATFAVQTSARKGMKKRFCVLSGAVFYVFRKRVSPSAAMSTHAMQCFVLTCDSSVTSLHNSRKKRHGFSLDAHGSMQVLGQFKLVTNQMQWVKALEDAIEEYGSQVSPFGNTARTIGDDVTCFLVTMHVHSASDDVVLAVRASCVDVLIPYMEDILDVIEMRHIRSITVTDDDKLCIKAAARRRGKRARQLMVSAADVQSVADAMQGVHQEWVASNE